VASKAGSTNTTQQISRGNTSTTTVGSVGFSGETEIALQAIFAANMQRQREAEALNFNRLLSFAQAGNTQVAQAVDVNNVSRYFPLVALVFGVVLLGGAVFHRSR
jgi:hypothetical protein